MTAEDRLAWADAYVPTTNIDRLADDLREHGFEMFAVSIDGFLGSTGAAYSARGYGEITREAERYRQALEEVKGRFDAYTKSDVNDQFKGACSEGLAIIDAALAEDPPNGL